MRAILVAGGSEYGKRSLSRIRHISIHHWGPPVLTTLDPHEEYRWMLRIRDFHRNDPEHLWPGYAYHFTVFPSGRTYYTGDIETSRYVVGNQNPLNVAVALAGDFTNAPPTEAAIRAARRIVAEIQFEVGRGFLPVYPHRLTPEAKPTACPGDTWESWFDRVVVTGPPPIVPIPDGDEREANVQRSIRYADEYGVERRYVLGGGIAEGGLWNANRRPKDPADDANDWPDVSEGVLQQTVAWSDEYQDEGGDPETYPGPETVERILALYRDPEHAFLMAMPQLVEKWIEENGDALNALCRYNWPDKEPTQNPNRANYQRGLAAADRILAGESVVEVLGR